MRCNGRLSKADLPSSIKYPILLDKGHHITSLIVQDSHKRVMHGGVKLTLKELRARFWNVQGRQFVKRLLYKCVICRKLEGRPYQAPPSPPLPELRVKECPPFPSLVLILQALSMSKTILVPSRKYGSVFTHAASPGLFIWILYQASPPLHS